jgi:glutathione synthase/RimK-type ligase-like ATP-grasp enzyme
MTGMQAPAPLRRLGIAASRFYPGVYPDDAHLMQCLRDQRIEPIQASWNDPEVDWAAFDAILIRTTWDYFRHYEQFLQWLQRIEQLGVLTINPVPLLRWNSDKRYLLELPAHGVEIIPTRVVHGRDVQAALGAMAGEHVVIKPTVSGTAWHTVRGVVDTPELNAAVSDLPPQMDYLIQPFMREIERDGEISMLFFGDEFSHAVRKRPATNDYRVQSEFGGSVEVIHPEANLLASAHRALRSVSELGYRGGSYARIDGVLSNGRFLIMEVEMIEPALYFEGNVAASRRFAEVITQQVLLK